jgi:IMP dehydrogenase
MRPANEVLTFDDVTLVPQYSEMMSRSTPSTNIKIGNFELTTPIISANMDTVTGPAMCVAMRSAGGIGALHRFMTFDENISAYNSVSLAFGGMSSCFVTVGVTGDYVSRAAALYEAGARDFIVDIAHGHSLHMKNALEKLRNVYGDDINIMAGNIATPAAVNDLVSWGANIIKVGVGGGSICKTRIVTGHGIPMFTTIQECSDALGGRALLIADGGMRSSGDIVKSFVAGADAVMLGSLLAGTDETPGQPIQIITNAGSAEYWKTYRGMASSEAQADRQWGSNDVKVAPEGVSTRIRCKGPVRDIVHELTMGLKSGMSYCNAATLEQIFSRAHWRKQSLASMIEGTPHILGGKS